MIVTNPLKTAVCEYFYKFRELEFTVFEHIEIMIFAFGNKNTDYTHISRIGSDQHF